jgi:hypothetical protein
VELTGEQRAEWLAIVSCLPPNWFPRQAYPLLVQYCRHVVASRRIAQLVEIEEGSDAFDPESYDRLLKMQERETKALAALAVKMRLSRSAVDDRWNQPRPAATGPKPWQD